MGGGLEPTKKGDKMKRIVFFTFFMVFSIQLFSQSSSYKTAMKNALTIHDTASSVHSEIKSLEAFEKVTRDFPDEWLGHYWTAYILTQVARLKTRVDDFPEHLVPKEMLLKSQKHWDKAHDLREGLSKNERSDLHFLQGFLYFSNFRLFAETEEEKKKFNKLEKEEYKEALKLNPQNPSYYVNRGIRMIFENDDNYEDLVTAIGLLDHANEVFSAVSERSETTYFSKDFIPFWRGQAEKKLKELLK